MHNYVYAASFLFYHIHSQPSSFILLGYCTMNTAWSVRQVSTYLNSMISAVLLNFDLLILTLKPLRFL